MENDEHASKGVLANAGVAFEVLTVLFEDVEGFVLELPSGVDALGGVGDIVAVNGQAGDEHAAVGDGAVGSPADAP